MLKRNRRLSVKWVHSDRAADGGMTDEEHPVEPRSLEARDVIVENRLGGAGFDLHVARSPVEGCAATRSTSGIDPLSVEIRLQPIWESIRSANSSNSRSCRRGIISSAAETNS